MTSPTPDTHVPRGETPAASCPYCDRPFAADRDLSLHLGRDHPDAITPDERERYETARDAEHDALWLYHAKVVGALGAIYAITVILYLVAIQSGFL